MFFAEIEGAAGGALIKRGLGKIGWVELVTNLGRKKEYSMDKRSPKSRV